MIDYTELPEDGILFEQLIRELFVRENYETFWTGVGPDGGRDLIVTEVLKGSLSTYKRKWLISCKHNAHAGRPVGRDSVPNIVDACRAINADGFILACSTYPSSALVTRLEEIEHNQNILTKIWDGVEIERRLTKPNTYSLIKTFLPKNEINFKWDIYNTRSPSFWSANHRGYFFYLSSRTANSFPSLDDVDAVLNKIEAIKLPEPKENHWWNKHMIRLRAMYFDNKHENYIIFIDYIFPEDEKKENLITPKQFSEILKPGMGLYSDDIAMWKIAYWDVCYQKAIISSDHFHEDHKDYYVSFMNNYQYGRERDCNRLSW